MRQYMEGQSDGTKEKASVDAILRWILREKIDLCRQTLAMEREDCIENEPKQS